MQATDGQSSSLSRLVAFSDSIFAFASTLLVIVFPFQMQALPQGPILKQVLALKGTFLIFMVTFYSIGAFWLAHHRYFRYIQNLISGSSPSTRRCYCSLPFSPFPPTY
jgi:uncharacterized membrane protein